MFKVSFNKESKRVQTFNDKVTIVTLTGRMKLPDWFHLIPTTIDDWLWEYPGVVYDVDLAAWEAIIKTTGKATCSDGDKWDPIIGERIAEARAKLKLYRFVYNLAKRLVYYYFGIIYGVTQKKEYIHTAVRPKLYGGLVEDCKKYTALQIKESHHLGQLIEHGSD